MHETWDAWVTYVAYVATLYTIHAPHVCTSHRNFQVVHYVLRALRYICSKSAANIATSSCSLHLRRRKSIKMGSNISWNWILVMREW
jgi:hypothetical protein